MSEGSKTKTALMTVGIIAALALAVFLAWRGLIAVAELAIMQTPPNWDVSLGEMASKEIETNSYVCGDPELNAFAEDVGNALLDEVDDPPFEFSFKVVRDEAINAFALPGGFVFINTGLLDRAEDSSELAGVLGHEIQHALLRHGMKRVGRNLALTIILSFAFGDIGGFATAAAKTASDLGSLSFDRGDETEADIRGLPLVANAGFEPEGIIDFFKLLKEEEKKRSMEGTALIGYLSTHPLTDDRIDALRAEIEDHRIRPDRDHADRLADFDRRLEALRGRCGDAVDYDDSGEHRRDRDSDEHDDRHDGDRSGSRRGETVDEEGGSGDRDSRGGQ